MASSSKYEGIKIEKGLTTNVVDPLTVEHALQIDINDKAFTVVMQTPGDEEDLATGLLFAEDVIKIKTPLVFEHHYNENQVIERINLTLPENQIGDGYLSARSLLSVSSCGICGKQSLEDLQIQSGKLKDDNVKRWNVQDLFELQQKMIDQQSNFKLTGGCHGVAAFDNAKNLLTIKEDIGRHNAMDKVVGQLIKNKTLPDANVITFSGRVSYEIVAKAFRAKIGIIMAVSSPSTLALDFAKEYGITIIGFARNNKMTCYANTQRLSE